MPSNLIWHTAYVYRHRAACDWIHTSTWSVRKRTHAIQRQLFPIWQVHQDRIWCTRVHSGRIVAYLPVGEVTHSSAAHVSRHIHTHICAHTHIVAFFAICLIHSSINVYVNISYIHDLLTRYLNLITEESETITYSIRCTLACQSGTMRACIYSHPSPRFTFSPKAAATQ